MKKKFLFFAIVATVSVIGLIFYREPVKIAVNPIFSSSEKTTSTLRVIFFDVGQGDSALIITPQGRTILVDGGPDDKVLSKLGKYLPLNQKKIDYMILTHPHADHLDGLVSVLSRYGVGAVYYSGVAHTTYAFMEWLKLLKEKNIAMKIIDKPQVLALDSKVKLDFLYPNTSLRATEGSVAISSSANEVSKFQQGSDLNNVSIVFKLIYGQTKFLFTGDAEMPVEEELLACHPREARPRAASGSGDPEKKQLGSAGFPIKSGMTGGACDLRADVLKVAHHGSHSSSSDKFLEAVQPRSAIISVGAGNDFGHPHSRTLRRLERQGVKIYRTDEIGDVEIVSDGESIK